MQEKRGREYPARVRQYYLGTLHAKERVLRFESGRGLEIPANQALLLSDWARHRLLIMEGVRWVPICRGFAATSGSLCQFEGTVREHVHLSHVVCSRTASDGLALAALATSDADGAAPSHPARRAAPCYELRRRNSTASLPAAFSTESARRLPSRSALWAASDVSCECPGRRALRQRTSTCTTSIALFP